jgi:hypothetical protein
MGMPHVRTRPRHIALALLAALTAFLYAENFMPFLQFASTDASVGDTTGALVLRLVPNILVPIIAGAVGLIVFYRTHHSLFRASVGVVVCAFALELVVTLWVAEGSVVP